MRASTNPDGEEYFEYILLYVDDCLDISHKPEEILKEEIGKHFKLKEESIRTKVLYWTYVWDMNRNI